MGTWISKLTSGAQKVLRHFPVAQRGRFLNASLMALVQCSMVENWSRLVMYSPTPPPASWTEILHFDIKPSNLFVGSSDAAHPDTPIVKYGDFGHAEQITQARNASATAANRTWKSDDIRPYKGTDQYYPPELFHQDWDHRNWFQSPIAGNFNGETYNQFKIGQVMWQLLTLATSPPEPKDAFMPNFTINGVAPLGLTYGPELSSKKWESQCGKALTDLVFSCLYQDPSHRISLSELKLRVTQGHAVALAARPYREPLSNFLPRPTDEEVIHRRCTIKLRDKKGRLKQCKRYRWGKREDKAICYQCTYNGHY